MANIELLITDHTELTKHGSIIRSIPENTLTDLDVFGIKMLNNFRSSEISIFK